MYYRDIQLKWGEGKNSHWFAYSEKSSHIWFVHRGIIHFFKYLYIKFVFTNNHILDTTY